MTILSINVYNYNRGGSETVYFNTSRLLREHGHKVVEFALKWDDNQESDYSRYFAESKESRRGPLRHAANIVTYFYHFGAAKQLQKLIDEVKPDAAIIHLIWGQLTPSILKVLNRNKIPAILTAHDYRIVCPAFLFRNGRGEICEQCEGHKFYRCIVNKCCKGSRGLSAMMAAEQYFRNRFFNPAKMVDGLIFVSNFSRRMHLKYMSALETIPSITLYNVAKSIDSAVSEPSPERYMLFAGRLSLEKGCRTLIEAFIKTPEARLIVAGEGPEEEALKRRVAESGATNISFAGYKSGRELETLIRGALFMVVPSECYENNPLSVVEAYSAGVPVIGAEIGGIPEIIKEGMTGFCFESGNVDALSATVEKAMRLDSEKYRDMQQAALRFARENFNGENYYSRLSEFIDEVKRRYRRP